MVRLKHPLDLPDLATSDCCLSPTIKERLKDIQMVDKQDLVSRLEEFLSGIPRRELAKVFGTWINCLMAVSRDDGTYISERIKVF
jgi:hypothetical protein